MRNIIMFLLGLAAFVAVSCMTPRLPEEHDAPGASKLWYVLWSQDAITENKITGPEQEEVLARVRGLLEPYGFNILVGSTSTPIPDTASAITVHAEFSETSPWGFIMGSATSLDYGDKLRDRATSPRKGVSARALAGFGRMKHGMAYRGKYPKALAHVIAHEIGHMVGLVHLGNGGYGLQGMGSDPYQQNFWFIHSRLYLEALRDGRLGSVPAPSVWNPKLTRLCSGCSSKH